MNDTIETNRDWASYWTDAASRVDPENFLAQVGYTINGIPIDAVQIDLIVEAVLQSLAIGPSDVVLDLCCGNGLISHRIGSVARLVYGVDYSPSLISVARSRFGRDNITYFCRSVSDLDVADFDGGQITKACMIYALQHFTRQGVLSFIEKIRALSGVLVPIYFANIPDVDHLYDFYNTSERRAEYERRRTAGTEAIGTWWNRQQLAELFEVSGYAVDIVAQNPDRFCSHYRFDMLAKPQ